MKALHDSCLAMILGSFWKISSLACGRLIAREQWICPTQREKEKKEKHTKTIDEKEFVLQNWTGESVFRERMGWKRVRGSF